MKRELPHFKLKNLGKSHKYRHKGGGSDSQAKKIPNRIAHAQALLKALDYLPDIKKENLPGLYLEITEKNQEKLAAKSLNASGLTLLHYNKNNEAEGEQNTATVFATQKGVKELYRKIEQFETEDTLPREKNGKNIPSHPKNENLVRSIAAIIEAGLRALWRSPTNKFPTGSDPVNWEVWLDPVSGDKFTNEAAKYGVMIGKERLNFPEDIVTIANAAPAALAQAVRNLGGVRALAIPTTTAEFFDDMDIEEQADWVEYLKKRIVEPTSSNSIDYGYVTLMDTGVNRAHPLIQPFLSPNDRHAAEPAWALDDINGHGTKMAGLALYGDLAPCLQSTTPITVTNHLESIKLLPDSGNNPHHLLGAVTRKAIDIIEANAYPRRRTFAMINTTEDDSPHDGAPTSWSTELDQLASGSSGKQNDKRLIVISAGNSNQELFGKNNYLDVADHVDNEIESPAQAWNAVCVGAYTEKTQLPAGENGKIVAPFGDLSPSSRTASWASHWPIKPDVVLEGGNWVLDALPPPMRHSALSLLTTDSDYPKRSFCPTHDTSAATALAAKEITELWSEYPDLWPETIRALYISSARWTLQMRTHLPMKPQKGEYTKLFQRYGYGVPDLVRAQRSASNALTLLIEDTIIPYKKSDKGKNYIFNEMKIFNLPWPVKALRELGNEQVTLRVTLSTFIAPNPSEASRAINKYGYASHNLRFKLNHANENQNDFIARISKPESDEDRNKSTETDLWEFGVNRRDVGSLHIDQLTCNASDLAQCNLIAVHPIQGWWKSNKCPQDNSSVRYSLIIEIDAENIEVDLYSEVKTKVEAIAEIKQKTEVVI